MKYNKTLFTINTTDETLRQASREILAEQLAECGYESFVDTDEGIEGYIQRDFYAEQAVSAVTSDFFIEGVSIDFHTEPVEDQDWNEVWEQEQGFEPITIGDRMLIYDALHTDPLSLGRDYEIEIAIRARNAFGTGTHETTRMILTTILGMDLRGKRVLDCGCGTGILGIAALKCGASEAVGYDIDEWSVENTRYNAMLNGVEPLTVYEGDSNVLTHISGVFDVVFANINRNILLNDMEEFCNVMNSHATLVLSGFYAADVPLLLARAEELGLHLAEQRSQGDWYCLVLK